MPMQSNNDVRGTCPSCVASYVHGLILGLLILLPMRSLAQFTYADNYNGTLTVLRYIGAEKSVYIPSAANGLPVTGVGSYCFAQSAVTSVTLPVTITSLNPKAFSFCGITNLFIPAGVTNIYGQLFGSTPNLVEVVVDAANPAYMSLDGVLFDKAGTTLLTYPTGKPGSYSLPNTVLQIAPGAFGECTGLTNVDLHASLTSVGSNAFYGCTGLRSITIPASVTNIGVRAFSGAGLTNIAVHPENLVYKDDAGMLLSKDGGQFLRWPGGRVGTCTVPSTVTNIGIAAFEESLAGTTNVIVPSSVLTVSESAFRSCPGLEGVQFPDQLISIGDTAFYSSKALKSVTIPQSVGHIGFRAFVACSALQAINASELNPIFASLDGVLFTKDLSKLLAFPGGKTGRYVIPTGTSRIGNRSFEDCGSVTSVVIPSTVTNIETYAFFGCRGLTSITIPASVMYIGTMAFTSTGIRAAYFLGSPPQPEEDDIFDQGMTGLFILPDAVGWKLFFSDVWAKQWNPRADTSRRDFGIRTNGFGFMIIGVTNIDARVVVEASTSLSSDTWVPISTNRMMAGYSQCTDTGWTNSLNRYYRFRSPE